MVSRASSRVPRDEIVNRGTLSRNLHNHPWTYSAKVKSGTRRTENVSLIAYNQVDMFGHLVAHHARRGEDLFVFGVARVAKFQRRARDY